MRRIKMPLDLRCQAADGRRFAQAVRAAAKSLVRLLALPSAELSMVPRGDAAIRGLNRNFRGKDSPTDVLSFPQFDDVAECAARCALPASSGPPITLGDVVISIETAVRQAHAMGI